jgi:hypothetical protein
MAFTIYDAFLPLHCWSRLFGLSCFSLKKSNGERKARITILNLLFMFVLLGIFIYLLLGYIMQSQRIFDKVNSALLEYWLPIMNLTTAMAAICNILWTFCMRHNFAKLFNAFHVMDVEVILYFFK